jgi:hypothetical protein
VFDLGYLGVEKVFPEQMSSLPNKKKRNRELSVEQEEYNLGQAKKRIVGHTICRVKKYRKKHNLLFVSDLKCCYFSTDFPFFRLVVLRGDGIVRKRMRSIP